MLPIQAAGTPDRKDHMVIHATLSKALFIQLSILRHFQRLTFYVYATLCAGVTAYVLLQGADPRLLLLGWIPFGMYMLSGILSAIRASRVKNAPYFLPTRYEFTPAGITISTSQGRSQLGWEHIESWGKMVNCYVLVLQGNAVLAIPQEAILPHQVAGFETLLQKQIDSRSKGEPSSRVS